MRPNDQKCSPFIPALRLKTRSAFVLPAQPARRFIAVLSFSLRSLSSCWQIKNLILRVEEGKISRISCWRTMQKTLSAAAGSSSRLQSQTKVSAYAKRSWSAAAAAYR